MNTRRFADGYPSNVPAPREDFFNDSTYQLPATQTEWGNAFSSLLTTYLENGHIPGASQKLTDFVLAHCVTNLNDQLDFNLGNNDLGSEEYFGSFQPMANLSLSVGMAPSWSILAFPEQKVDAAFVSQMQAHLALRALTLCRHRAAQVRKTGPDWFYSNERKEFRQRFDGTLGQFDAAIVLLGITRKNPNIITVLAPPRYESGGVDERNVDFVLIDRDTEQAHGVQVKTGYSSRKYDPRYVSMVSTEADFGATTVIRPNPKRSNTVSVPHPGLISAHLITQAKLHGPDSLTALGSPQSLVQRLFEARYIMGQHKAWRPDIISKVQKRLVDALHRSDKAVGQEELIQAAS